MNTKFRSVDEIVCRARANKMSDHPFFTRLAHEPLNQTALWSFYANLSEVRAKGPDWITRLVNHSGDVRIKCLFSPTLFRELDGVHCLPVTEISQALLPWEPEHTNWDPQQPGKILAAQMDKIFTRSEEMDMDFVVGSLISGDIYAQQMIFVLADVVRNQFKDSSDGLEWQRIHLEFESDPARASVDLGDFVPDGGPRLDRVRAGATWVRDSLWAWLDGIYRAAYSGSQNASP